MNTPLYRKCSTCGSELILISSVTEQIEGSKFPQTTTIYRCSNQECQDEKDLQAQKRMQQQKEKKQADERRADKVLAARKLRLATKLK